MDYTLFQGRMVTSRMDDRTRYETVKSRLRAMVQSTAQRVHAAMPEPNPYSLNEVKSTLNELVLAEPDEFERSGDVYCWKKLHRFPAGERRPQ